jgi:molecular chaperone GrpE (heat shock protein)
MNKGVAKIDAVGKPFDVHYHEAIMQRTDDVILNHILYWMK